MSDHMKNIESSAKKKRPKKSVTFADTSESMNIWPTIQQTRAVNLKQTSRKSTIDAKLNGNTGVPKQRGRPKKNTNLLLSRSNGVPKKSEACSKLLRINLVASPLAEQLVEKERTKRKKENRTVSIMNSSTVQRQKQSGTLVQRTSSTVNEVEVSVQNFDQMVMNSPFFQQLAIQIGEIVRNQDYLERRQDILESKMKDILGGTSNRSALTTQTIENLSRNLSQVGTNMKRCRDGIAGMNIVSQPKRKKLMKKTETIVEPTRAIVAPKDPNEIASTSNVAPAVVTPSVSCRSILRPIAQLETTENPNVSYVQLSNSAMSYDTGISLQTTLNLPTSANQSIPHGIAPNPVYKNIDKTQHLQNPNSKKCVFCHKTYTRIVNHYKNYHSDKEIVVSRLTPAMAKEVQQDRPKLVVVGKYPLNPKRFVEAKCHFCDSIKNFTTQHWQDHVRGHTGEYSNECRVCKMSFAGPTIHCRLTTVRVSEGFKQHHDLVGYLCLECNFVQIEETNIVQHLRTQHELNDDVLNTKYKMITFISLAKKTVENPNLSQQRQSSIGMLDNDSKEMDAIDGSFGWENVSELEGRTESEPVPQLETSGASENLQYHIQQSLKNDPAERENLFNVAGFYMQITQYEIQVKPWIDDYWTKPAISTISQFALFKCMHPQCIYSTNSVDGMALHMDSHLTLIDVMMKQIGSLTKECRDEQIKFRDCCYCDSEARYNNELLSHIIQEHIHSMYQCSYCFYRSIEVDNMILHYQSLHPMEKPEILICGNGHDVEFGQQDHEILSHECEKNIDKIECGQDTCTAKFDVFNDLFLHLDKDHASNVDFTCVYCLETVKKRELEKHLNLHQFWDFQCIFCSFGGNDIDSMKKHLASKHPSKYAFVGSRRKFPEVKPISDTTSITMVYTGGMTDHKPYTFYKLSPEVNLNCMKPALYTYETHRLQQTDPAPKIVWTAELPKVIFNAAFDNFFIDHDDYLPFKCNYVNSNGNACLYATQKDNDMWRHIGESHANSSLNYKFVEASSRSLRVVKLVESVFECNICQMKFEHRRLMDKHFNEKHMKFYVDAQIIQDIKVIESTDPKQPVNSKETSNNRLIYSALFYCTRDGYYSNTKAGLIQHFRNQHAAFDLLEMTVRTNLYRSSWFDWNPDDFTRENQQFDRMVVYKCYSCTRDCADIQRTFESITEIQKHCQRTHDSQAPLYMVSKLVACIKCRRVSTSDGIKKHYLNEHKSSRFVLGSVTNRNQCGVCNHLARDIVGLEQHFYSQHAPTDAYERFRNAMLDKLEVPTNINNVQYSPKCCKHIKYRNIPDVVDHVINCQSNNFAQIRLTLDVQGFYRLFSGMLVFLCTGLVVQFKCIEETKIGDQMMGILQKQLKDKVWYQN